MKIIFFLFFCIPVFAFPTLQEADQFISEQLENSDSRLNQKIIQLKSTIKLPGTTALLIHEPGILIEKPVQNFEDCLIQNCKLYQRKIYSKILSFRTDYKYKKNHSIWIQWIEVVVSYKKTWTIDTQKQPNELIQDQFVLEGVYFLQ